VSDGGEKRKATQMCADAPPEEEIGKERKESMLRATVSLGQSLAPSMIL